MEKTLYVQGNMGASCKYFKEQKYFTLRITQAFRLWTGW